MSSWGKWGGELLGEGKSLFDHAKRLTGEAVDEGADVTGDALDEIGAHGTAQKVRHGGDRVASYLGAHVAERQLGPDAEPSDLIHGKPSTIREKARHLLVFAVAFEEVGVGMKAVDSDGWQGEAADTFREKFALHPTKWLQAAVAFQQAAAALNGLARRGRRGKRSACTSRASPPPTRTANRSTPTASMWNWAVTPPGPALLRRIPARRSCGRRRRSSTRRAGSGTKSPVRRRPS
jgi:hypothetical protein